jgi:hydrogenase maturation protein HypF
MAELSATRVRRRLDVRGQVQGVGFRPYVYRIARDLGLAGSVANDGHGARIEVEGPPPLLEAFEGRLEAELPPLARISGLDRTELPPDGSSEFRIVASETADGRKPEVTPDAALCVDCLRELFDPTDRRYRYPFITCTNCGPRYSIVRAVPYDRPLTTMAEFELCGPCRREYEDPGDRRFHAQPLACPDCGPRLELRRVDGSALGGDPIVETARLLRRGRVVAIKGVGGYHLACRADREDAVVRLRTRKRRDGKPFALMVADLEDARRIVELSEADEQVLVSAAAPIVLAPKLDANGIAASVAPGCRDYGVMLPYAPLHWLLFAEGLGPLVMTSANRSGRPLTYLDEAAFRELAGVADAFLVHDRRIERPVDDSVVFTFRDAVLPARRARGYAPRPLRLPRGDGAEPLPWIGPERILAMGGELKSAVCLLADGEAILGEHLGDLMQPEAYRHYVGAVGRLKELFGFEAGIVAHDLHPDYAATRHARRMEVPALAFQHHHAHAASLMAEWGEPGPWIALACDGTGYGTDGAIWGGEVLLARLDGFERLGHLEYFPLVGGDAAAMETWRPAAALLRQARGSGWRESCAGLFKRQEPADLERFERQAASGMNAPPTSSLGRAFDAAAYILGLCERNRHEAEAAMALEAAAGTAPAEPLPWAVTDSEGTLVLSLAPALAAMDELRQGGHPVEVLAARFHETVARMLAEAASRAAEATGIRTVGLTGGCFQNRRLLGRTVELLEVLGFEVRVHRRVPPGDGGLALGQAVLAAARLRSRPEPGRGSS